MKKNKSRGRSIILRGLKTKGLELPMGKSVKVGEIKRKENIQQSKAEFRLMRHPK